MDYRRIGIMEEWKNGRNTGRMEYWNVGMMEKNGNKF
jgi:hypothetical protein